MTADRERITTTERPLRDELARVLKREVWTVKVAGLSDAEANHLADAVLPIIEQATAAAYERARSDWPRMLTNAEVAAFNRGQAAGRVRVVEGLVATIKALSEALAHYASEAAWERDDGPGPEIDTAGHMLWWYFGDGTGRPPWEVARDALAVVEAAREDTT